MNHFLRPYKSVGVFVLAGLGTGLVAGPPGLQAQSTQVFDLLQGTSPLLLHSNSQGYLGAYVEDVDADKAQALKLKEVRGAVITLIDHDAPAGQSGLHVNDVVLQLNGQNVEGAEQLRRMLREIPPGRKVSLEFSRDGNLQTTSVELADRRAMEKDVWNKLGTQSDTMAPTPGMGVLAGGGDGSLPGMFHMPIFGGTLNVGAMVEPLTGQMAEYLGVPNGLMVKQVAHKSEASAAGFKAFDVILKVGSDAVTTLSDWDRALRANQGKPVQVTILRDRKQQTLTLQVDSKHKTGALELEPLVPAGDCAEVAELDPDMEQAFGSSDQEAAKLLMDQAQGMKDLARELSNQALVNSDTLKLDGLKLDDFKIDPKQMDELRQQMDQFQKNFKAEDFKVDPALAEQMRKQAEALRDQIQSGDFTKDFKNLPKGLNLDDFKVDPKQMEEMKQQMEQFQKNFKAEDFKVDPALAEQLRKQAEALRDQLKLQNFKPEDFQIDQKQLEEMKRQMDQFHDMMPPQEAPGVGVSGPPV